MYESQVTFTLDTQALSNFRSSSPQSSSISYTLHFAPYQLNPDFPPEADRHKWYLENKHFGDDAAQRAFQEHMASVAEPLGIALRFDGRKGNTLHAHRVVQYFQDAKGAETASKLLDALYVRYFEKGEHPSTDETLVGACVEAGIPGEEARRVVEDKDLGLAEVKRRLREVSRDVDAVPVVVVEGRKRDITLIGAKEVGDYLKALEKIASESS
ncbi:thioredoxin-like protein [Trichoderma citrinoviride]|uniref:Thioredoxin-like protein n=1 Tax=Trichoderma citrinoviride TaxID=58853 RepID=A0A2T4BKC0_9HYPO|nr:thioredoxin-like protein [Trichoderma citrinoviride]PTB69757.1 thioredoxin-like protein [Trichoderma citrinoviride]